MSRATQELQSIPFRHLIGAPLNAAIEAQAESAQVTIDFIQKVGFVPPATTPGTTTSYQWGDVRQVTFKYRKVSATGALIDASLEVPVLSIVPIPFIRIEEVNIDFTAKINEVETEATNTALSVGVEAEGAYSSWLSPVRVSFKASMSYNRNTASTSKFEKEYQMRVTVRATQDDMPAGLSKVLQILEKIIVERSTANALTT
jgi:hypothetical protein